jgi:hypothetical protein
VTSVGVIGWAVATILLGALAVWSLVSGAPLIFTVPVYVLFVVAAWCWLITPRRPS